MPAGSGVGWGYRRPNWRGALTRRTRRSATGSRASAARPGPRSPCCGCPTRPRQPRSVCCPDGMATMLPGSVRRCMAGVELHVVSAWSSGSVSDRIGAHALTAETARRVFETAARQNRRPSKWFTGPRRPCPRPWAKLRPAIQCSQRAALSSAPPLSRPQSGAYPSASRSRRRHPQDSH